MRYDVYGNTYHGSRLGGIDKYEPSHRLWDRHAESEAVSAALDRYSATCRCNDLRNDPPAAHCPNCNRSAEIGGSE